MIGKKEYLSLLKTYAKSHRKTLQGGKIVRWIDESLNGDTGAWIPTEGEPPRGKDYNHSTYCDLVISGLIGFSPRGNDILEINPLVPDGIWDYFCLDHIRYHGRIITVVFDKTGQHYGKGKGLTVFVDGKSIVCSNKLEHVRGRMLATISMWTLPTKQAATPFRFRSWLLSDP